MFYIEQNTCRFFLHLATIFFGQHGNRVTKLKTRTTRTPAFWGYNPPPRDYPYYWPINFVSQVHFISDPKSKQGESRRIRKICGKFKFRIVLYILQATHTLMVVIICGKYGNNRSRTENVTEWTRFSKSRSNDLEDIGPRSKVITCNTPSHASDHLYQIWKESTKNCRCYRADTIFKAKAKWPWRYMSRSNVIICNTPSHTSDHLC